MAGLAVPSTVAPLTLMGAQGHGRIVYVSGAVADGPPAPGMAAHGAAEAALDTFSPASCVTPSPPRSRAARCSPLVGGRQPGQADPVPQVEVRPGIAVREPPGGLVVAGLHEEGVEVEPAVSLAHDATSGFELS
ncbi:hypothetical protein [Streptomyces sp. NPDC006739]|uniref:hypothetical protein n=1 Tax=Streptomyces sp. NPDC006739 TaxID=3364763 RepID=UPI003676553A